MEPFQSGEVTGGGRVEDAEDLLPDLLVREHPGVDLLLVEGDQVVEAMEVEDLGELLEQFEHFRGDHHHGPTYLLIIINVFIQSAIFIGYCVHMVRIQL